MDIIYFDRLNKNKENSRTLYKEVDDYKLYDYKNGQIEIESPTNSIKGEHLVRLDDICFLSEEFISDDSFKRYGFLIKGSICNYNKLYEICNYSIVEYFDCNSSNFKRKKLAVLVAKYVNYYLYDCNDGFSILDGTKYDSPKKFKNAVLINDYERKILFLGKNSLCEKRICFLDKKD